MDSSGTHPFLSKAALVLLFGGALLFAPLFGVASSSCPAISGSSGRSSTNSSLTLYDNLGLLNSTSQLYATLQQPAYASLKNLLSDPSQNLTLFAPNNGAINSTLNPTTNFTATLSLASLTYHVLGSNMPSSSFNRTFQFPATILNDPTYVNLGANVSQVLGVALVRNCTMIVSQGSYYTTSHRFDLLASNGILHIVNALLPIPLPVYDTAAAANLTAFNTAVQTVNLTQTLNSQPNITIFAADNHAFRKYFIKVANSTNQNLNTTLSNHLVNGTTVYYTPNLPVNGTLTTWGNAELSIYKVGRVYIVEGVPIVLPNLLTMNGVIQVLPWVINATNFHN